MSESKKTEQVPTFYVPTGREHFTQETNEKAEIIVADMMSKGEHVHTWSKDTGTLCPGDQCTPSSNVVAKPDKK